MHKIPKKNHLNSNDRGKHTHAQFCNFVRFISSRSTVAANISLVLGHGRVVARASSQHPRGISVKNHQPETIIKTETVCCKFELGSRFRNCVTSCTSSPVIYICRLHVDISYLHARVSSCQTCPFVRLDMSVVIVYNIVSYNIINLSF